MIQFNSKIRIVEGRIELGPENGKFELMIFRPTDKILIWRNEVQAMRNFLLKTLILLITFQKWVLELCCFTWIFSVIRYFCWYLTFWSIFPKNGHCSKVLNYKYSSFHTFILRMSISCDKVFPSGIKVLSLWLCH